MWTNQPNLQRDSFREVVAEDGHIDYEQLYTTFLTLRPVDQDINPAGGTTISWAGGTDISRDIPSPFPADFVMVPADCAMHISWSMTFEVTPGGSSERYYPLAELVVNDQVIAGSHDAFVADATISPFATCHLTPTPVKLTAGDMVKCRVTPSLGDTDAPVMLRGIWSVFNAITF